MWESLRYRNWSLRTKFAALLIVASILPSAVTAYISLLSIKKEKISDLERGLIARTEQLSHELDTLHMGYARSLQRVALQPVLAEYCSVDGRGKALAAQRVAGILEAFPKSDQNIRGMAVLGEEGVVEVSTDKLIVGRHYSSRATVVEALRGNALISDIYLSQTHGDNAPTVAYLAPVLGQDGTVRCVIAMWINAQMVWNVLQEAHAKAGPGSFAVLYDQQGVRIGHSFRPELLFRPSGELSAQVRDLFVATARFGPDTEKYLRDVRPFPEQFDQARSPTVAKAVFRGYASATGTWNLGVGSRLRNVQWTVFFMIPETSLLAAVAAATKGYLVLFSLITVCAAGLGFAFAASIVKPILELRSATRRVATGHPDVRVTFTRGDEFGHLAQNFNDMAEEIQTQATHLLESHERVVAHANDLEAANKDLDAFAHSVSHDLRSPLGVVSGFSALLAARHLQPGDEKAARYISRIQSSTKHMSELIEGLLRLSRLGRQPLKKEHLRLSGLVEEVVEQLATEQLLHTDAVRVVTDLPEVLGDRVLLGQVLVNLLSNAAKFTSKVQVPVIEISAISNDSEVVVSISDNGPGFDSAQADRLFKPFQRLHSTDDYAGIGLGLSIVQRIVTRHGGTVWANSTPGKGASFSFSLPTQTLGSNGPEDWPARRGLNIEP